jgi:hypothetical protein
MAEENPSLRHLWSARLLRPVDRAGNWGSCSKLREAFPDQPATQLLILDHDSQYGTEVPDAIRSMGIKAVGTVVGCPWQNGVAERWVGNCRRELLDHVTAIKEFRARRLNHEPHNSWAAAGLTA